MSDRISFDLEALRYYAQRLREQADGLPTPSSVTRLNVNDTCGAASNFTIRLRQSAQITSRELDALIRQLEETSKALDETATMVDDGEGLKIAEIDTVGAPALEAAFRTQPGASQPGTAPVKREY